VRTEKRFVVGLMMQIRKCFARAKPFRLKKSRFSVFFYFQKKPNVFEKSQSFKVWLMASKKPNWQACANIHVYNVIMPNQPFTVLKSTRHTWLIFLPELGYGQRWPECIFTKSNRVRKRSSFQVNLNLKPHPNPNCNLMLTPKPNANP